MEQIYTIPINEAFEACAGHDECPLCKIYNKFDADEIDLILGASMMEPAVRIKTNEQGFCREHYSKMLRAGKKLPLALLLESHLEKTSGKMKIGSILPKVRAKGAANAIDNLSSDCYVCSRISSNFEKVLDNAVYMWSTDEAFRSLFSKQKCFCLPHYSALIKAASKRMKGDSLGQFITAARRIEEKYMERVRENISHFAKKFDYRYEDEPWGDAKDAVERAIAFLEGNE